MATTKMETHDNQEATGCNVAPYVPTPEEIEAQCREIRAGWTEEEALRRSRTTRPSKFCKRVHRMHLSPNEIDSVA